MTDSDLILDMLRALRSDVRALEKRIAGLERWRAFILGGATVVGSLLGALVQRWFH